MTYLKSIFAIMTMMFFLIGCETFGVGVQGPGTQPPPKKYEKHGPPPHAPAHGYRHKHHDGHQMEYDSRIGAYVVLNIPETYFGNNLYIRLSTDGKWMVSTTLDGGWRLAAGNEVPPKLAESKYQHKYEKKKQKNKKNKKKYKYGDDDQ